MNSIEVDICEKCGIVFDPKITNSICPVCTLLDRDLLKEMVIDAMKKKNLELVQDDSNNITLQSKKSKREKIMAFPKNTRRKIEVNGKSYEYAAKGGHGEDPNWHLINIYINNVSDATKSSFEIIVKRLDDYKSDALMPVTPSLIECLIKNNKL